MTGKIQYYQGQIIFIKSADNIIPVFPVYADRTPYYPLVSAYCFTVHKVMGQMLNHITFDFDSRYLALAIEYVPLSRASHIENVVPMLRRQKSHFIYY